MTQVPNSIPRPLVRINQWFIVLSVILAWLASAHWILILPLIVGGMGLAFHFNPVMRIAKLFLSRPASSYIPEDKDQQQFNQWIAVICLLVSSIGFWTKTPAIGYVFSAMVLIAALVAICGFCIGCFLRFQWLRYRHRRQPQQ